MDRGHGHLLSPALPNGLHDLAQPAVSPVTHCLSECPAVPGSGPWSWSTCMGARGTKQRSGLCRANAQPGAGKAMNREGTVPVGRGEWWQVCGSGL